MTQEQEQQPQPSFEEALEQLRQTVSALEQGDVPLAEATSLFERGILLATRCHKLLDEAELRVGELERGFRDQMRLREAASPSEAYLVEEPPPELV